MQQFPKLNKETIKQGLEIAKIAAIYIGIYVGFALLMRHYEVSVDDVRSYFEQFGGFAIFVFLLGILVVALTPLPDTPVVSAGILILGVPLGFITIWSGLVLAAVINFYISKFLGRDFISRRYPLAVDYMDKMSERSGVEVIIVGRAMAFLTFDIISYAAGLTKMPLWKFVVASIVGIFPVTINYTIIGAGVASMSPAGFVLSTVLAIAIALLLGLGSRIARSKGII